MLGRWLARRQPGWIEHLRLGAPLRVGPTGAVALVVRGRWEPKGVFVQLISKIDESHSHNQAPFITMAGFTGRLGQWQRFDRKWRKALRKAGLEYYHAQQMPLHPFAIKAVQIPDRELLFGFVVRLNRRDFNEVYKYGPWGGKAQPDSVYGLCFRFCLAMILEVSIREYQHPRLDFIIESGHQNEGAPSEILRRLRSLDLEGVSEFLGTVTPMGKRESYGLQAADALATGAAWQEDPAGSTRAPMVNVSDASRLSDLYGRSLTKIPIFRLQPSREQIAAFRDSQFKRIELQREFGHRRNAEIEARKRAKALRES